MRVAVFTIVKNEHKFLDEWIKYHLGLGIDEIYVYTDIGSDSHADICSECNVHHGFISDIDTSLLSYKEMVFNRQLTYFRQIADTISAESNIDWVAYLDVDEFITLHSEKTIHQLLAEFSQYHCVILQWKNFNASGHILSPKGSVISNYSTTCDICTGFNMNRCASCKMFINVGKYSVAKVALTHHIPVSACRWCKTDFSTNLFVPVYDKMYLRHYITKSFEDYCNKLYNRGQFYNSKGLAHFFLLNKDIRRDHPMVDSIINSYYDKYMNGDIDFLVKVRI